MVNWLVELIAWIIAELLGYETGDAIDRLKIRKWLKITISFLLVVIIMSILIIFFRA